MLRTCRTQDDVLCQQEITFVNINNKSIKCFHDVSQVALVQKGFNSSDTAPEQSNSGCQRGGCQDNRTHKKIEDANKREATSSYVPPVNGTFE